MGRHSRAAISIAPATALQYEGFRTRIGGMVKYFLSIDGGGILGAIPAAILADLEARTGKRCGNLFSFVAGTSTGSIITACIAAGVRASRIADIYCQRCGEIFFPRPPW